MQYFILDERMTLCGYPFCIHFSVQTRIFAFLCVVFYIAVSHLVIERSRVREIKKTQLHNSLLTHSYIDVFGVFDYIVVSCTLCTSSCTIYIVLLLFSRTFSRCWLSCPVLAVSAQCCCCCSLSCFIAHTLVVPRLVGCHIYGMTYDAQKDRQLDA